MAKFRWSKDDGANWTVVEASLPYNISGVTASDTVIVEPIGDAVTDVGYEAEASALFARMSTQPNVARKTIINTLIKSLKDDGIWSKLDVLYLLAAHDSQAAKLNLISSSYELVSIGSPTFTVDVGFTGNASTTGLNTNLIPSTFGGHYSLNSATIGIGISNARAGFNSAQFGTYDTTAPSTLTQMLVRYSDDKSYFAINQNANLNITNTITKAIHSIVRLTSSDVIRYINGTPSSGSSASNRLSQNSIYFLARNQDGALNAPCNDTAWCAFIGSHLTGPEMSSFVTTLNTYGTAIGAI